jgi:hypothetical protein
MHDGAGAEDRNLGAPSTHPHAEGICEEILSVVRCLSVRLRSGLPLEMAHGILRSDRLLVAYCMRDSVLLAVIDVVGCGLSYRGLR